jgi:hypothetical protein
MLKKTLHTAVAAIAVSMICLPAAEAKEDLILSFEDMSYDFVGWESFQPKSHQEYSGDYDPGEVNHMKYEQGTMKFGKKTVDAFRTYKFPNGRGYVEGNHAVCDAVHSGFQAIEASILLRGDNQENTLTLSSVSLDDSRDLANPYASGWCVETNEDGSGSGTKLVINYERRNSTGKWSCSYIEEQAISHVAVFTGTYAEYPQFLDRPFNSSFGFDSRDKKESNHYGTVVINRSTCF